MENQTKYGHVDLPSQAYMHETESDEQEQPDLYGEKYAAMYDYCAATNRLALLLEREAEAKAAFKNLKKELNEAIRTAKSRCYELGIATEAESPVVVQFVSGETGELFGEYSSDF